MDLFARRVHPLVKGFREIKQLDKSISYRSEWLKYGAIGYIACVEGYFRLLIADIIDSGEPFVERIGELKEIRFTPESVVAIHKKKVSLGHFVAHLLPLNGLSDINSHLSALLATDYTRFFSAHPLSQWNTSPVGEVFPHLLAQVETLFKLRHMYAHELATKERVPLRALEDLISSAAVLVRCTEEFVTESWQIRP
ncbi:hypothetical protein [Vulcaniibacterium tengchongense]|uniref:hypothetical protein n=1 Tax=Vulcaniibacterium tengchongense TaxID=1273429 RepID=UPI000F4E8A63|nr:hypothetical protein [Vulcaniibacterium tengchongense]